MLQPQSPARSPAPLAGRSPARSPGRPRAWWLLKTVTALPARHVLPILHCTAVHHCYCLAIALHYIAPFPKMLLVSRQTLKRGSGAFMEEARLMMSRHRVDGVQWRDLSEFLWCEWGCSIAGSCSSVCNDVIFVLAFNTIKHIAIRPCLRHCETTHLMQRYLVLSRTQITVL